MLYLQNLERTVQQDIYFPINRKLVETWGLVTYVEKTNVCIFGVDER